MTVEYLVMGETGRKTYFKKENNKLTRIKYREYSLATKPAKKSKSAAKNSKISDDEETLVFSDEEKAEPVPRFFGNSLSKKEKFISKNPEKTKNGNSSSDSDEKPKKSKTHAILDSSSSDEKPKKSKKRSDSEDSDEKPKKSKKHADSDSDEKPKKSKKNAILDSSSSDEKPKKSKKQSDSDSSSSDEKSKKSKKPSDSDSDEKPKKSKKPSVKAPDSDDEPEKETESDSPIEGGKKLKRRVKKSRKSRSDINDVSMDDVKKTLGTLLSRKDRISEILGSSFSNEMLGLINDNISVPSTLPPKSMTNESSITYGIEGGGGDEQTIDGGGFHKISRQEYIIPEIVRCRVEDPYVSWENTYPEYLPVEHTQKIDNENADPEIITKEVQDEIRNGKRKQLIDTMIQFDDSGRPKNPYGRTGVRGKGVFMFWGPNWYVFPLFLRRHRTESSNEGVIELMTLKSKDRFYCPTPSYSKIDPDTISISSQLNDALKKCDVNLDSIISDANKISTNKFYLDSSKNTDNAWALMCVYVYNVGNKVFNNSCVEWIPLKTYSTLEQQMDAEHLQIINEILGEQLIDVETVDPEIADTLQSAQEPQIPQTQQSPRSARIGGFVKLVGHQH
jgi:hypothetical protein